MFSGIIVRTGSLLSIKPTSAGGAILWIEAGDLPGRIKPGDSIAVDGVCLTVVRKQATKLRIDVAAETSKVTNLKSRRAGDLVNLELPLSTGSLISGHFVQGHVDGIAKVKALKNRGREDVRLRLGLGDGLREFCVRKGSIAVNGVSLTIAALSGNSVEIALIPYTLAHTNLGHLHVGDEVNVETDVIGRYVVNAIKTEYHIRKSRTHRRDAERSEKRRG